MLVGADNGIEQNPPAIRRGRSIGGGRDESAPTAAKLPHLGYRVSCVHLHNLPLDLPYNQEKINP